MADCHFILSKSASLITANATSWSECLYTLHIFNQNFSLSHPLSSESHDNSQCDQKSLRNVRNYDSNNENKISDNVWTICKSHKESNQPEAHGNQSKNFNKPV